MTNTFNPDPRKFGKLIKMKREAKCWNQSNLAELALNNADRKSAVSDIETGKKKLTTKDVRKFLTALGAPQEEIDYWLGNTPLNTEKLQEKLCSLKDKNSSLEDAIKQIKTTNRDGLELLARRFDLKIADNISEYDLRQLLTKQAEQFQKLKAEVEALRRKYPQLDNIISDALATLEKGDTAAVRKMVRQARNVLRDAHLLDGLKQDADLVHVDAQALITEGDVQQAYDILTAAADSFASIDPLEPSRRRNTYGNILYDYGLRFAGDALALAAQMFGKATDDVDPTVDAMLWAGLQNNLGNALLTLGQRESGTARLEQAMVAYHNALQERTQDKVPLGWAMTQGNLGNVNIVYFDKTKDGARLDKAEAHVQAALQVFEQAAPHYAGMARELLQQIAERREAAG